MSLRRRLDRLGTLAGRFESEFTDALGPPHSIKTLVSGRHLVEWRGGLFRTRMIVVLFDLDHRFDAVVACHPKMPTRSGASPSATSEDTMSVRQTLALIDLRDAAHSADARHSRHGMWARSRR